MLVYQRRQFSIFARVSKQNFSVDSTMHTQLAEALTKTNSVRNDPATARESSKLVRPAKAPNRPSGGYAFPQGQRTPTEERQALSCSVGPFHEHDQRPRGQRRTRPVQTTHCARPQNPGLPHRRLSGFRAPARRHTDHEMAQRHSLAGRHHLRPPLTGRSGPWRGQESRRNVANELQGHGTSLNRSQIQDL